ncbi:MAG TPA: NAD(P)H-binding protein [Solirubrobacteraceae bacterium]|jgi:uncharacterized protein YbjT (DUF2867 family)|nr:NAD(P)H-binding protein [Solirubrobacteraceae bacterium]
MRILVIGASGFAGSLLVPVLSARGHAVRALGRDPERVRAALSRTRWEWRRQDVDVVRADVLSGDGLARALAGVEVAYYLIHSMERTPADGAVFAERERVAAENFATAAAAEGVRRIVYLGGLAPRGGSQAAPAGAVDGARVSRHLASRAQVEQILLGAVADSLALRASIVIGARSRSFRLLVHLLERMPVLTLPAWQALRTQPIDARDVIDMLAACATARLSGRSLDIGGPDVLTYGEMLSGIAQLMLVNRPTVRLRVNLTGVTARVAAAIASEDPELVVPLMEGLRDDLLPRDDHAAQLLGVRLHSFDAAVEHALAEWVQSEPLAAR